MCIGTGGATFHDNVIKAYQCDFEDYRNHKLGRQPLDQHYALAVTHCMRPDLVSEPTPGAL